MLNYPTFHRRVRRTIDCRRSVLEQSLLILCVLGPSSIRPNQSALRPEPQRRIRVQQEHRDLMSKSVSYLYHHCGVPKTASIIKQLSDQVEDRLTVRHMAPLSIYDELRARHELYLVHTIRLKLIRSKLVLRPTDKSGVFHISKASDYERKAATYRENTGAYIELPSNPLREIYEKVTRLLGDLKSKKQISVYKQYDKMMPHRDKVHLASMYFLPKAHKVGGIPSVIHLALTNLLM